MAHYAKIINGQVINVIVADEEYFETFVDSTPGDWIQTSYNTKENVHFGQDGNPDDGTALRYNYAFIGGLYNYQDDAFHAPQPFSSWTLNTDTYAWEAPVAPPEDLTETQSATWNEKTQSWDIIDSAE
ncbi:hypothetical protein MelnitzEXVC044M_176 [Methylophilales phage Melnitz EXVC044M]|nr:hypothetical protein Melnitz1EXVC043M_175 [Methylophilales phage Melnitz-1 EXVC043M]QZI94680.1 hypothetical protein Melnitz2EXVC040M_176 [Methylophilales phage Melnitz-2 EXVC040M]QZI94902.1 hypothetical protein MelnitzEXVC044M_176 [Methylophilales phage Melnitz EXVC044M]